MMKRKVLYFAMVGILSSCGGEKKSADEEKLQNMLVEDVPDVTVDVVREARFNNEIVSNGKAAASRYADVYWDVDGVIASIGAVNGRHVVEGEVLAELDAFRTQNALQSATADMERAQLSMYETIIGQGFDPDSANIPDKVRHLAEVKSGYMQSKASYMSAKYDYEHCTLRAPISGVVANVESKASNKADRGRPFCRIIDTNSMVAEFSVIENELSMVAVGDDVEVSAFSMPEKRWHGVISEINPFVEKNGMVSVKARIGNASDLYEGMNISVKIRKEAGVRMAVPKGAIVMRSNKPVVFSASNGEAKWHYVETSVENSELVAIVCDELSDGDTIVVAGNTFLAHNSKIKY